jgi:hypothetical protein
MPRRDDYDDEDDRYRDDRNDDRARDPRDEAYDDYDDRPRRGGRRAALERVSMPAIFLMIVGGLGLGMAVLNIVVEVTGMGGPNPFANPNQANDPAFKAGEQFGKVIGGVIQVLWAAIVFFGGLQMKNLKSRGFVFFSCIWAMLPCNLCCVLGIPFGIWAMVVINDENVRRAFARSSG